MDAFDEPYTYEVLSGAAREPQIRTLTLLPGPKNSSIGVQLHNVYLSNVDSNPYTALSYCWGEKQRSIRIETIARQNTPASTGFLNVTRNLYDALLQLRDERDARVYWIDALCINQNDLAERAAQVKLMAEIFSRARDTILWLGTAADNSHLAISKLQEWSDSLQRDQLVPGPKYFMLDGKKLEIGSTQTWIGGNSPEFGAVVALVMRNWFQRLWIRQELHHSQEKAVIRCGRDVITWTDFHRGFVTVLMDKHHGFSGGRYVEDLDAFFIRHFLIEQMVQGHGEVTFLLAVSSRALCEDPRDKVYGILGMLPAHLDWFRLETIVNYELSPTKVYTNCARLLIERTQSLRVLGYHQPRVKRANGLPTWAPDWTLARAPYWPTAYATAHTEARFYWESTSVLVVSARAVATVADVFTTTFKSNDGAIDKIASLLALCEEIAVVSQPGRNRDEILQGLSSVLLGMGTRIYAQRMGFHSWPPHGAIGSCMHTLTKLMDDAGHRYRRIGRGDDVWQDFLLDAIVRLEGYRFATTTDGDLFLCSSNVLKGDCMAILLGLEDPIVLRETSDDRYEIVGICNIPRFSTGSGLLGDLDTEWLCVKKYAQDWEGYQFVFKNQLTDELTQLDPRIDWQCLAVAERDPRASRLFSKQGQGSFRRPDKEYFEKHGVVFEKFRLV